MIDAFGNEFNVGDKILYHTESWGYAIGEALESKPHEEHAALDRVSVKILKRSPQPYENSFKQAEKVTIYTSSAVVLPVDIK